VTHAAPEASSDDNPSARPRVLILGGGFAGVGAAQRLKDANADVVLVDRHDYHTFQPLLYQLATGLLRDFQPRGVRVSSPGLATRRAWCAGSDGCCGVEALAVLVVVVLAPIAAVYAFVTGEPGQALIALGLFVGGIVYLVLVIFDAIDRAWDPRRRR
jgi:hypothetical protein